VGQVGALAVPTGADVISTEGMSVLPGLWDMHVHLMINGHSDYEHWDKTYPSRFEKEIMPLVTKSGQAIDEALSLRGMRPKDIDKVLLEYGVPMIDEDSKPITSPRS